MNRIGILTFHHVVNEGAFLQAFSLHKKLSEIFPESDVEIIDYRMKTVERRDRHAAFFQSRHPVYLFRNIRRYARFKAALRKLPLSKFKLETDTYEEAIRFLEGRYDAIVVGSDEIWKIEANRFSRPFPNAYWLSSDLACRKFSYAASGNKTKFNGISSEDRSFMHSSLSKFDRLGVRDRHTRSMLDALGLDGEKTAKVPDPTILVDFSEDSAREVLIKKKFDFNKPALGVTVPASFIPAEFFTILKRKGWQTVAFTGYNPHCDINLCDSLDPFQWAGLFRYFKFCITHLFHGSIFCLKNEIPFITVDSFANETYETKLQDLLGEFEQKESYVTDKDLKNNADDLLLKMENVMKNFDKEKVRRHMSRLRSIGSEFLSSFQRSEK